MSIFKPKNSSNWHYRFMSEGKVRTGSTHTANKANAVKFEDMKKEEAYKKQFLSSPEDRDHISIKKAITQYFDDNEHRTLPKTYHVFQTKTLGLKIDNRSGKQLKVFGLNEELHINELRERDVQALITARFKEGNSTATIIYELVFLAQVIKHVKRLGYLIPNIDFKELKTANKLQPSKGRQRYYSKQEEDSILHQLSVSLPTDTPITKMQRLDCLHYCTALADLGPRCGEVNILKWESIDMDQRMIRLYRPKVKNESVLMMSDRLFKVFEARHAVKANEQVYVFEGRKGGHITSMRRAFKSACERAGVKNATFHTFRHSFASKIVQAGGSLYDAQQLLGHANAATTQRYAHLVPTQSAHKAQQIINAINQGA